MHKAWYLLIIPGLLLMFILERPALFEQAGRDSYSEPGNPINYDSWSVGISTVLFNAQGSIEYTMEAKRQVHFLDNTTVLEEPFFSVFQANGQRWNVTANSGRVQQDAQASGNELAIGIDHIELIDQVELYHIDDYGNRIVISTPFLALNPQAETLHTEHAVHLLSSTLEQYAVGMHADLSANTVTFLSQVQGSYDIKAP